MKSYSSIIGLPLIGWIIYIFVIYYLKNNFENAESIKRFCDYYSVYLIILFYVPVIAQCYKNNFNFQQTFLTSFFFLYLSSILIWAGYLYSESTIIFTTSDVLLGLLSLFLYPAIFSAISSAIVSSIYVLIKKFK